MNFDKHPIKQILEMSRHWHDSILQFSEYSYLPQELLDERICFDIKSSELSEDWLTKKISSLDHGKELAIHSLVINHGKKMHIPMIDFNCPPDYLHKAKDILSKLLPNFVVTSLKFYSSGRSIHAYGSTLLKPKEWCQMMGQLLLANLPGHPSVVDTRWIGHRILGGYSSLRLSCNSGHYLHYPEMIKIDQ